MMNLPLRFGQQSMLERARAELEEIESTRDFLHELLGIGLFADITRSVDGFFLGQAPGDIGFNHFLGEPSAVALERAAQYLARMTPEVSEYVREYVRRQFGGYELPELEYFPEPDIEGSIEGRTVLSMRSWEFDAVTYDGEVYCKEHLPEGVDVDDEGVDPILADSEWNSYPTCTVCGYTHEYVGLTAEDEEHEAEDGFYSEEDIFED